jgi:hypothetical protein
VTDGPADSRPDDPGEAACATRSRALGEPLFGTASVISTWLMIEQPGAWPREALESRQLPHGIGAQLARKANQHRIRLVLIRRPGRSIVADPERSGPHAYLAHVHDAGPRLAEATFDSVTDVVDLDFLSLTDGRAKDFEVVDRPLFCVCTHGAHDPCCATRGRPVASALAARFPDQTWEISHIGGDRFAANIACFPHGYYFGRVPPHDAEGVLTDYAAGRLRLPFVRGRVCYPMVAQAAEHFLRVDRGIEQIDALRLRSRTRLQETHTEEIRFDLVAGGSAAVRVRSRRSEPARTLTCRSEQQVRPPTYELVGID